MLHPNPLHTNRSPRHVLLGLLWLWWHPQVLVGFLMRQQEVNQGALLCRKTHIGEEMFETVQKYRGRTLRSPCLSPGA